MRELLRSLFIALLVSGSAFSGFAQYQTGDFVTVDGAKFQLLSDNLIPNPGFEEGFTGWTDATTSAAELNSGKFTLVATGGIDNSAYLVGTVNESSSSSGSIGTGWAIEAGKTYYFSYNVKYRNNSAPAGTEEYLKISLTNNKTASAEPLVLLNSTKVNAGGEWTLNTVTFTNSDPAYSYLAARFRWLDSRFGFDNFSLHEAIEVPNNEALQESIEEAQSYYKTDANGANELQAAITTAQSFLTSSSADEIANAVKDLQNALWTYRLLNASSDEPVDMTHYIINQGFDNNTSTGWNGAGTVNYHEVEYYQKTFNLYQEITGLPAGKYTMKAQGFERPKENDSGAAYKAGTETIYSVIYAKSNNFGEKSVPVNSLYKHTYTGTGSHNGYVNTMASAEIMITNPNNEYYEMTLPGILLGEGESLIIGAKSDFQQTGYWTLFDNFRLQYEGRGMDDVIVSVNDLIAKAQGLASEKMQNNVLMKLNTVISQAQQAVTANPPVTEDLYSSNAQLLEVIDEATTSITAYNNLQTAIDTAVDTYGDGSAEGAEELQTAIDIAQVLAADLDASTDDIYAGIKAIDAAVLIFKLSNGSGTIPTVVTSPRFARGATMAFGRSTITGIPTSSLLERGFCWSTNPEPSVLDNRTTQYLTDNKNARVYKIDNLEPATIYYMRAYAITIDYAVGYGDVLKVITIPKGNVTYTLTNSVTNSGEHYPRIASAIESAVGYFNDLTSIQGHHLTIYHNSGTPTAEASYGGYMQFGANSSYQQTGTALHEMGHTIGVGQHAYWTNTSSSPLKVNGIWLGDRANAVVQFLENDASATLKGDHTHMWPYGINGASEDSGSEFLYIGNALIHQAIGEDGLPPNHWGFATPAYTFDNEEGTRYYIKNESEARGRNTSYLIEDGSGMLVYETMSGSEALSNDKAAWYLKYDPATCCYTIRNAANGNYFTYTSIGANGIRLTTKETPSSNEKFQLMMARTNTELGGGGISLTKRGYWIIHPEEASNPPCLNAVVSGATSASAFNILNTASTQRWLLLTENEAERFDLITGLEEVTTDRCFDVTGSEGGAIIICNDILSMKNNTIHVYAITGQIVKTVEISSDRTFVSLPKGIYIIANRKTAVL